MNGDGHEDGNQNEESQNSQTKSNNYTTKENNDDVGSNNVSSGNISCENEKKINSNVKKLILFEEILKLKTDDSIFYPDYSKKYLTKAIAETETDINSNNNSSDQRNQIQENTENISDNNNQNNDLPNFPNQIIKEVKSKQLILFDDILKSKGDEPIFYPDYSNHYSIEEIIETGTTINNNNDDSEQHNQIQENTENISDNNNNDFNNFQNITPQEESSKQLILFEEILKLKPDKPIFYPDYSKKYLTKEIAKTETTINNNNDDSEQYNQIQENTKNISDNNNNQNNNLSNFPNQNIKEVKSKQLILFEEILKLKGGEPIFYPDYSNHY